MDRTGTAPGRGAYVHARSDCIDGAVAADAIALVRGVRAEAAPDAAARLRTEIERERKV